MPLKSRARSLFFLGIENCWMTSGDGLWKSTDGGKSFKKISGSRFGRVHFLDARHGFAVGSDARQRIFAGAEAGILPPGDTLPGGVPVPRLREDLVPTRQLLESRDGGLTWKEHPVSKQLDGAFVNTLEFSGQRGAAFGVSSPRTGSHSATAVLASTGDGGATWTVSWPALLGLASAYRLAPGGAGYALVWLEGGSTPDRRRGRSSGDRGANALLRIVERLREGHCQAPGDG